MTEPSSTMTPATTPLAWPPRPSAHALLRAARAGRGDRLLILGAPDAPDLLCAAARRGCLSATSLARPQGRPEPSDLVLLPASAAGLPALLACARRALSQGGRLVLRLVGGSRRPGSGEPPPAIRALKRSLRGLGFEHIRLRHDAEGQALLLCRRGPMRQA